MFPWFAMFEEISYVRPTKTSTSTTGVRSFFLLRHGSPLLYKNGLTLTMEHTIEELGSLYLSKKNNSSQYKK